MHALATCQANARHVTASRRMCKRALPARRQPLPARFSISTGHTSTRRQAVEVPEIIQAALASTWEQHPGLPTGLLWNTTVFVLGYKVLRQGLTTEGVLHAWFLGTTILSAFGLRGYLLVCLYFIIGTLVTKVKLEQKQKEGIAEARSGKRGPGSVWGSGIAGVACAVIALATGQFSLWKIGFIASFGSKLSDTVSSEIGKAYGKTTYLVTSFERVPRGTEGAVSLEGTVAGLVAAAGFAGLAVGLGQATWQEAALVAVACVVANTFESYLGATTQNKVEWLTNDVVNMIQITLAAVLAVGLKLAVAA